LILNHDPSIVIMMSVKFQMVMPDDLAGELKAASERLKIPKATFVREAIERHLARASRQEGIHRYGLLPREHASP
jgi:Ribbon-helix-helix domain